MYIKDVLEKHKNKNISLFIDMDGTIADYELKYPIYYKNSRPLLDRINLLKELLNIYTNVEVYILSASATKKGLEEKNYWLDKYFNIKKENRIIIYRAPREEKTSADKKLDFLNNFDTDDLIIVIDDDPVVLKTINKHKNKNMILLKDSCLSK